MPSILKKIKRGFQRTPHKRMIIGVILVSFFIMLFPKSAEAAWFWEAEFWTEWLPGVLGLNFLNDAAQNLLNALITFLGTALVSIISPFLELSKSLLGWVTSDSFLSVGYLPKNNPIVALGWRRTRNFANMFFIVGLIVIGVATALRYKEYQAQKLLPKLLIIALLINFTPIIAGAIIDASNIAMDYFLSEINLNQGMAGDLQSTVKTLWSGVKKQNLTQTIGKVIVVVAFELVVMMAYFLYALLFAVRPIALWILVILSPLAFLCYIFPGTKQWWDQWWEQFFQWCIVGIAGAFFLFLAHQTMPEALKEMDVTLTQHPAGAEGAQETFFDYLAQYLVPIIFMYIGLILSQKSGAMGAETTINFARAGGRLARGGLRRGAEATGLPDRLRSRLEKMRTSEPPEREGKLAEEEFGRFDMGAKIGGVLAPHAMRRAIGRAGSRQLNTPAQQIEEDMKKYEDMDVGALQSHYMGATNKREKLTILKTALKKGVLDAMKKRGLSNSSIRDTLTQTAKVAPREIKDVLENTPTIANDVLDNISEERREETGFAFSREDEKKYGLRENGKPKYTAKMIAEMSHSTIENLSEDIFKQARRNPDSEIAQGMTFWAGGRVSKAAQEFGSTAAEAYNKAIEAKGVRGFARENQTGFEYAWDNTSNKWGIHLPPDTDEDTIKDLIGRTGGGGGTSTQDDEEPLIETP